MLEKKRHLLGVPRKARSIQHTMPKARLYASGMLSFGGDMYSATYKLKDVDFLSGSDEDQEDFFMAYSDVLNSLDSRVSTYKLTMIVDAIRNRLVVNRSVGKPTYIKIDEVGWFLNDMYLSRLFESFYAEVRKFGGYITGIVQNVNKLLHSEAGRNMLSNSEIVVMLRQSQIDAADLKELYELSNG